MSDSPDSEKLRRKPEKRGRFVQNEESKLLLVNEDGKAFQVHEVVVGIWNMCDGIRTLEDMAQNLAKESNQDPSRVKTEMLRLAVHLENAGLLALA